MPAVYEIPERQVPADDNGYLEQMTKAIFQSGFSWLVIRAKWPNFVRAFDQFDIATVADYDVPDKERLLNDETIVRNRRKIEATIQNARILRDLVAEHGSVWAYLRSLDGLPYPQTRNRLTQTFQHLGPTGVFVFLWCVAEDVPAWEERMADG
jgi:DNA-3-methyladenine glycosylase I